MTRTQLKNAKRVVIKIGTTSITNDKGEVDSKVIKDVAGQISKQVEEGREVILVTSGAIGSGKKELGITGNIRDVKLKQATAAVGQSLLMNDYHKAFAEHCRKVGQVLISYESFFDRKTYLNLKNSVAALLKLGVVPIINENDPLAVDEIGATFGDNDRLSALVASKTDANLLLMLTDIDGFYSKDPRKHKDARLLKTVNEITPEIRKNAGKTGSEVAKGGMKAKIDAAGIALDAGAYIVIANGREKNVINRVMQGEELGTLFIPQQRKTSKKRWISNAPPKGTIEVDEGAKKAILNGKNLLPAGVVGISGNFDKDDIVHISCKGSAFAKAMSDYSSGGLNKVRGKKAVEAKELCGAPHENVFRRENLVLSV